MIDIAIINKYLRDQLADLEYDFTELQLDAAFVREENRRLVDRLHARQIALEMVLRFLELDAWDRPSQPIANLQFNRGQLMTNVAFTMADMT